MFRNVATLFQHCNAVLRKKSSLRIIVPCNITLKVSNVIVAETSYQTIRSFIILLSGEGLTSFSINNRTNFLVEKSKMKFFGVLFFFLRTRAKTLISESRTRTRSRSQM